MEILILLLVVAAVFGGLGVYIANEKHRDGGEGFALGFFFGPLGCLIEAILPSQSGPAPTGYELDSDPVPTRQPVRAVAPPPAKPKPLGKVWMPCEMPADWTDGPDRKRPSRPSTDRE